MSLFSKLRDRYYRHRLIPAAVQELHDQVTKYLPNDARILEAGAHMGYDTVGISKMWPKGKVYAFEPVPSMFAGLQTRTSALRNVFSYQLALGENPGSVDMYVSD